MPAISTVECSSLAARSIACDESSFLLAANGRVTCVSLPCPRSLPRTVLAALLPAYACLPACPSLHAPFSDSAAPTPLLPDSNIQIDKCNYAHGADLRNLRGIVFLVVVFLYSFANVRARCGLSPCHVDHYHFNGRVHLTCAWRRSLAEETASSSNAVR